jgi:hypothetical protein
VHVRSAARATLLVRCGEASLEGLPSSGQVEYTAALAVPTIFLSYRRDDAPGHAGRLYDRLSARSGAEQVFCDIETIDPGLDFGDAVGKALQDCGIVLVMIGRTWLSATDVRRRRRLDLANDWVRIEVGTALGRGVRVIPVLVEDAAMPMEEELPDALSMLARRNAFELSDSGWDRDCGRLMEAIDRALGRASPSPQPQPTGYRGDHGAPQHPAPPPAPAGSVLMPQELVGLWQVEIRALIPSVMGIQFAPDGSCAGNQKVFGVDVSFAGRWGFDPASRMIQIAAMAMFQPLAFAVWISARTPDGFLGVDAQNISYVFHRLA